MDRTTIHSSVIKTIGYDCTTETLEIESCSGYIYEYQKVPEPIYMDLAYPNRDGTYTRPDLRSYPYRVLTK